MTLAIRVKNLVKTYPGRPPVEAVRGVDLEIPSGECFGLLGPNGAGKTTRTCCSSTGQPPAWTRSPAGSCGTW